MEREIISVTNNPLVTTVLIVDDEEAVRSVISRMLQRSGFTVQTAPDGPSAIALVAQGIPHLRMVLIDLSMPGMNGDVVARSLAPLVSDVALVLMSGYQPDELLERYPDLGLHGFLQKPFTREMLIHSVTTVLASFNTPSPPNDLPNDAFSI